MSGHGELNYELSNGYNVGQELCLGALTFFHPQIHDYVSTKYIEIFKYKHLLLTVKTMSE